MNQPRIAAVLPRRPVERLIAPVKRFLHIEAASGVVLVAATALALLLANSPWAAEFAKLWKTHIVITVGTFTLEGSLGHLVINDGLMTIFFFVVGLEIKRELVAGELSTVRKALLPLFAALGGMIAPAVVYLLLQWGRPGERGWAVPMATDIAFVVGIVALLGSRVPFSLKIFLLSLAIVDDLGAVLIIALAFSGHLNLSWLLAAAAALAVIVLLNRLGVRQVAIYVFVGVLVWLGFFKGGIHPTVAGVILGLLTPSSAWLGETNLSEILNPYLSEGESEKSELESLRFAIRELESPLHRLETGLHPWVAFVIMPLFAFSNAGVAIDTSALQQPVALAVAAGLLLGKPIGILGFSLLAIRLRLAERPRGVTTRMLAGAACLGGIGFTMALFINGLAFATDELHPLQDAGKVGTLLGSLLSALLGMVALLLATRKR